MANYRNVNCPGKIINRINHAVIADTQPPEIFLSMKLDNAGRSRVSGQQFNLCENPIRNIIGKPLQFLARGTGEADGVISHSAWILAVAGRMRVSRAARGRAPWPAACRKNPPKATHETAANACINNLRQIESAKEQWALENGKTNGTIVTENDIKPYIKLDSNGNLPKCPAGGTYIIGRVGENPKCSVGTSAWPNSHVLPGGDKENWWTDFKAAYGILFGLRHFQKP